ncbi:hypothetical protein [Flavobacterium columnare]|uniref:hypothetical protein n=2 Tax=Flavobacterium columnare TaxID=996 RepID=UPI003C2E7B31
MPEYLAYAIFRNKLNKTDKRMKKSILLFSSLLAIGCKTDNYSIEKMKTPNFSQSTEQFSTTDESNEEDNTPYLIPSEKKKFPFIIDQKVYNELIDLDSPYIAIKDSNVINKLLTPKHKKELISLRKNSNLLKKYSFTKIGERKIKDFKVTFFSSRYHGNRKFITIFANVTKENSSKIIDSKKVGDYYSYAGIGGSKLVTLVMHKTGKIEITTMVDKDKPVMKNLIIGMNGKIVATR